MFNAWCSPFTTILYLLSLENIYFWFPNIWRFSNFFSFFKICFLAYLHCNQRTYSACNSLKFARVCKKHAYSVVISAMFCKYVKFVNCIVFYILIDFLSFILSITERCMLKLPVMLIVLSISLFSSIFLCIYFEAMSLGKYKLSIIISFSFISIKCISCLS